jgi:mono/diheme cytochrome c family protein
MKAILFLCSGLLLMQPALAKDPDVANGKKLFNSANCMSCHGTDVFTRSDRKVKDLIALEKQVRHCDASTNTNWFDDEIKDVVAYLNQSYYKFP